MDSLSLETYGQGMDEDHGHDEAVKPCPVMRRGQGVGVDGRCSVRHGPKTVLGLGVAKKAGIAMSAIVKFFKIVQVPVAHVLCSASECKQSALISEQALMPCRSRLSSMQAFGPEMKSGYGP